MDSYQVCFGHTGNSPILGIEVKIWTMPCEVPKSHSLREDVRQSPSPRDALLSFLESTYEAGARLADWNRKELERIKLTAQRIINKNVQKFPEITMSTKCRHLNQIKISSTDTHVCEDCVKIGDTWVHLRMCMECGHVGCCDSSKNKHATKHFHQTTHPVMRSIEPGEDWIWCYVDEIIAGEVAA